MHDLPRKDSQRINPPIQCSLDGCSHEFCIRCIKKWSRVSSQSCRGITPVPSAGKPISNSNTIIKSSTSSWGGHSIGVIATTSRPFKNNIQSPWSPCCGSLQCRPPNCLRTPSSTCPLPTSRSSTPLALIWPKGFLDSFSRQPYDFKCD